MSIEKIIKFVEGTLPFEEIKELEKQFLQNPDLLEVVGGLNRIKKQLPPSKSLNDYLQSKKKTIGKQIFDKEWDDVNSPAFEY